MHARVCTAKVELVKAGLGLSGPRKCGRVATGLYCSYIGTYVQMGGIDNPDTKAGVVVEE